MAHRHDFAFAGEDPQHYGLESVLTHYWDVPTLSWIKGTQPGAAGGGALTDAELRASAVAVTGPLTDAQLRATAVPVSATSLPLPTGAATSALQTQPGVDIGDVTVNNAAGASAVNVQDGGNSLTVDGTVAATQSGTWTAQPGNTPNTTPWLVSTKTDLAPSAPAAATVGVSSAQAVAANAARKGLVLVNVSSARISFGLGATAVLDSGITLYPGGVFEMDEWTFDVGAVNAIASAAASPLAVQEMA